ncbi:MAG TPA: hypothetical protein PK299_13880 [Anaerolineales bacterium]|nr:hypothetical protein [Anaerolineales bacterium]
MGLFFQKIWRDIKQRKNIELYVILLLSMIILVMDIFDVASDSALQGILLAVMSVLVYGLIESRHSSEEIISELHSLKQSMNPSASLKRWQPAEITSAFTKAKKISFLNVANYSWVGHNHAVLRTFLKSGGTIRCILVEPDSEAFHMILDRDPKGTADADGLRMDIQLSEKLLYQIGREADNESGVEVRFVKSLPPMVMTMVNENLENGEIFVSFNGYKQEYDERPSVTLKKIQDGEWFTYYQNTFNNYWENTTKSKTA